MLPPDLLQLLERRSSFVYTRNAVQLEEIFAAHRKPCAEGSNYVFAVFRDDGFPVGAVALEFDARVYFGERIVRDVLEAAVAIAAESAKFLFQRGAQKLIVDPIFRSRETRIIQNQVFVLMPFEEPWSARIWKRILKPAIESEGLAAVRADDLYGHDIMEDIWEGILRSECVVAETTGRNPNVFYELGIAHTLGKEIVLLTQNVEDIPFDLNRYRHIIYEDHFDGYNHLKQELTGSLRELVRARVE